MLDAMQVVNGYLQDIHTALRKVPALRNLEVYAEKMNVIYFGAYEQEAVRHLQMLESNLIRLFAEGVAGVTLTHCELKTRHWLVGARVVGVDNTFTVALTLTFKTTVFDSVPLFEALKPRIDTFVANSL